MSFNLFKLPFFNPYWDEVKEHVWIDQRPWGSEYQIGGNYLGKDKIDWSKEPRRHDLVRKYSWTVPDPNSIEFVTKYCDRPVLDPLAGTGYWAAMLIQKGVDIICSDLAPGTNPYHNGMPLWTSMFQEDALDAVKQWGDRTLLLSWPPYGEMIGYEIARKYIDRGGSRIIYIGENEYGCCGTEEMFEQFDRWDEVASHRPMQWFGMHDYITVYERKAIEA